MIDISQKTPLLISASSAAYLDIDLLYNSVLKNKINDKVHKLYFIFSMFLISYNGDLFSFSASKIICSLGLESKLL